MHRWLPANGLKLEGGATGTGITSRPASMGPPSLAENSSIWRSRSLGSISRAASHVVEPFRSFFGRAGVADRERYGPSSGPVYAQIPIRGELATGRKAALSPRWMSAP